MALTDKLTAIGNAIRTKTGGSALIPLSDMPAEILSIETSSGVPVETLSYNQMNEHAGGYYSEVTYDPSDYTNSSITDYVISDDSDESDSKPLGATIQILSAGTLTVTDGKRSVSQAVSAGSFTIYNVTPGNVGNYVVRNSLDEVVAAGILKPTGGLRMLSIPHMFNVRDLGGWTCDGGTVKYGMLIRGGHLKNINASDAAVLHDFLGIRAELSLMLESEENHTASPIGADVDFRRIDGPMYTLGSGGWQEEALRQILDYVMDSVTENKPLYFHCYYGADRTGTVAFILSALLGVSQSDTDKDYEMTCFQSGTSTDSEARRRNESEWRNYMAEFSVYPGNTMRDKVVYYVQSLGITIEKINAYRAAMINGTPGTLTNLAGSVSVTNTLTGATTDNSDISAIKFQPYRAKIRPTPGKVITGVTVTMGGTDISNQVFSGTETIFKHAVSYNLTDCYLIDNPIRKAVVNKECFCCQIRANAGYTLDGATVSITMGGIDMSNYYKDGTIQIPKVTGNITVTVTAVASASNYTNRVPEAVDSDKQTIYNNPNGYMNDTRLNSSGGTTTTDAAGVTTTGFISASTGDVVRFSGVTWNTGACYIHEYNSNLVQKRSLRGDQTTPTKEGDVYVIPLTHQETAYIRLSGVGNGADLIVTINEPID